eukprot:Nk52_evm137s226 gene=Nk52_evmTU137s226
MSNLVLNAGEFRYLQDNVHGHIPLHPLLVNFIDTPQFQRLRDIKQLSSAYYVYPGASHNRFEHSVGVGYLAGKWVGKLKERQPELEISNRDSNCVQIAGLCHDIGHGPFSHSFDAKFLPRVLPKGVTWRHEDGSEMMLDYLIEDNHIDMDKNHVDFIKSLIAGSSPMASEKRFLYDIVANYRNGIDVDKFDYLKRDCYNVGYPSSYDSSRLFDFSRVIGDEICFQDKEVLNIYKLFNTRYDLHKIVYSHKTSCAIENMVVDAMIEAEPYLKISDAIFAPEKFLNLTDNIVKQIEFSEGPELENARGILRRIRRRDLYKYVDQVIVDKHMFQRVKEQINEDDIAEHKPLDSKLKGSDLLINWINVNYGMKDKNPVDCVKFYTRYDSEESFNIDKSTVSYLLPQVFQEHILRVFCKNPELVYDAQKAFRKFSSKILNGSPQKCSKAMTIPTPDHISPAKKRKISISTRYDI